MSEDMSEFEEELSDIEDPHPLKFTEYDAERAPVIARLTSELANLVLDDLVAAMNARHPALVQYLWPDGTALTAILSSPKTLVLTVQHAGDKQWVRWPT